MNFTPMLEVMSYRLSGLADLIMEDHFDSGIIKEPIQVQVLKVINYKDGGLSTVKEIFFWHEEGNFAGRKWPGHQNRITSFVNLQISSTGQPLERGDNTKAANHT